MTVTAPDHPPPTSASSSTTPPLTVPVVSSTHTPTHLYVTRNVPSVFKQRESLLLRFNGHLSGGPGVSRYQNVSILDFIGDKDDGGGPPPRWW